MRHREHLTTAHYQPHSNGQAERFVDTFKRAVKKISEEGRSDDTLQMFLQATPNRSLTGYQSPAESFISRKILIELDLLRPKTRGTILRNEQMEHHYNEKRGARLREFAVGDLVLATMYAGNKPYWAEGQVTKTDFGTTLYEVVAQSRYGLRTFKAHANQLRPRYYDLT